MSEGQNPGSAPPGAGDDAPDGMSDAEFAQWLAADPKNQEHFHQIVEKISRGEYGELPMELRTGAAELAAKHRTWRALQSVGEKFRALQEVMQRPGGTMQAEDRLAQCNALADELTDALLETPEPYRTRFLRPLLPVREKLRALRVKED